MYSDRTRLHKHGYQHRCVKILDRMLVGNYFPLKISKKKCFDKIRI